MNSASGMRSSAAAMAVIALLALPVRASAQDVGEPVADSAALVSAAHLPLLRHLPDPVPGSCPAAPAPTNDAADSTSRAEAERLATEASNAAILGDLAAARDLLARAASLDPQSAAIAFRLARTHDDLGASEPAVREYCRYLQLAPDAPDAAEVNATVQRLAEPVRPGVPDDAVAAFEVALEHVDAGRLAAALDAFTAVADAAPDWPVPWYDRGIVHAELRQRDAARADFERFLALEPAGAASDRVRHWITQLETRSAPYSAGTAFAAGLIPGAGHFYTGRPAMGALLLVGAGGAAVAGMLLQERHIECLGTPQNGVCPPDQVRDERVERPYMMAGLGAAAAAAVIGAIDAARGARSRNAAAPIIHFGSDATGAGAGLHGPDVQYSGSRIDVALLRLRF